jgi:hypothetical protein
MPLRRDEPLVTIATFDNGFEAGLARGALEAIGIQALVPEDAFFRQGVVATPASLRVFQSDSARALVELRRMQIRIVKRTADEI